MLANSNHISKYIIFIFTFCCVSLPMGPSIAYIHNEAYLSAFLPLDLLWSSLTNSIIRTGCTNLLAISL